MSLPTAYKGSERFAFISYSHQESGRVLSIIDELINSGHRIWYDEGIPLGTEFSGVISGRIAACSRFVLFLSKQSAVSTEVHKEIMQARLAGKTIIPVVFDVSAYNLLPPRIGVFLSRDMQYLSWKDGDPSVMRRLTEALAVCRDSRPSPFIGRRPGDTVLFGRYPHSINSTAAIEWVVLQVSSRKALVVSRYALDCVRYDENGTASDWENCSLRGWLNDQFFKRAFDVGERQYILNGWVENDDSTKFGTGGGNRTIDRLFCLSTQEARSLFAGDMHRICQPTAYAMQMGAQNGVQGAGMNTGCVWWLRSPGSAGYAANVLNGGFVNTYGSEKDQADIAVRPAFYTVV